MWCFCFYLGFHYFSLRRGEGGSGVYVSRLERRGCRNSVGMMFIRVGQAVNSKTLGWWKCGSFQATPRVEYWTLNFYTKCSHLDKWQDSWLVFKCFMLNYWRSHTHTRVHLFFFFLENAFLDACLKRKTNLSIPAAFYIRNLIHIQTALVVDGVQDT